MERKATRIARKGRWRANLTGQERLINRRPEETRNKPWQKQKRKKQNSRNSAGRLKGRKTTKKGKEESLQKGESPGGTSGSGDRGGKKDAANTIVTGTKRWDLSGKRPKKSQRKPQISDKTNWRNTTPYETNKPRVMKEGRKRLQTERCSPKNPKFVRKDCEMKR